MPEICAVFAALVVLAALGFGAIWLVLAAVRQPKTGALGRCRRCGGLLDRECCIACGMTTKAAGEWADWRATLRHLGAFRDRGFIDEPTYTRLSQFTAHHCRELIRAEPPVRERPAASEAILDVLPADAPTKPVTAVVAEPPPVVAESVAPAPTVQSEPSPVPSAEPRGHWLAALPGLDRRSCSRPWGISSSPTRNAGRPWRRHSRSTRMRCSC